MRFSHDADFLFAKDMVKLYRNRNPTEQCVEALTVLPCVFLSFKISLCFLLSRDFLSPF